MPGPEVAAPVAWLAAPVLLGLIPAVIAHGKGRSFGNWWLYGIALPFFALPHALSLQAFDCPECAMPVPADSLTCEVCGAQFVPKATAAKRPPWEKPPGSSVERLHEGAGDSSKGARLSP